MIPLLRTNRLSVSSHWSAWFALGWLVVVAPVDAGYVIGIDFITTPRFNALAGLVPINNVFPFSLTDPTTQFAQHGALNGVTEIELQGAIVDAVQAIFRRAEIGVPGQMLNVDIRLGPVDPTVGTVQIVAGGFAPTTTFGLAYATGARTRPDLTPGSVYSNELSIVYADSINGIPNLDPQLRFDTMEQVVQAIAGTSAHELGHTLDVWNHDPAAVSVGGWYPIMGTGSTGLPLSARLQERRFLDIPGTQYQFPGPPAGGPLIYSTTETLLNTAGTTAVSDFNFDGVVDGSDFGIWNANKFLSGTGVKTGDANDDGVTDGTDFGIWNLQRGFGSLNRNESLESPAISVPEPTFSLGFLAALAIFRKFSGSLLQWGPPRVRVTKVDGEMRDTRA